jgi:hypothetical protein
MCVYVYIYVWREREREIRIHNWVHLKPQHIKQAKLPLYVKTEYCFLSKYIDLSVCYKLDPPALP